MRTTLSRFGRLTAGYSLVTLIGPLFTILLTPLYTRALQPSDYGVVDVAVALTSFLTALTTFGIDAALSLFYFEGDDARRRDLVTTALACVAGLGMLIGLGVIALSQPIATWLYGDPARQTVLLFVALNALTAPLYFVASAALRLRMDVRRVNALGLTYLFATVAANVVLVLVLRFKATGVVAAGSLAYGAGAVAGVLLARSVFGGQPKRDLGVQLLRGGASLLPGVMSYLLLAGIDRILLTQYVTQAEIGLYGIANKLGSMMYVITNAAWAAWWPLALEMAGKPDATRQYARMFEYFLAGSATLALCLGLFAPEILSVFTTAAYVPAAPYALALMAYFGPLQIAASCFSIGLYVGKRTQYVSLALAIAAAVNVGLNLLLNPTLRVWGAVIATLAGGAIYALCIYAFSQRTLHVTYRWLRTSALIAAYALIVAAFLTVPVLDNIPAKAAAIATFTALVFVLGIVSLAQVQMGWQLARARLGQLFS
jgi:O-antigen/teichoic acid export membrane protein